LTLSCIDRGGRFWPMMSKKSAILLPSHASPDHPPRNRFRTSFVGTPDGARVEHSDRSVDADEW